MNTDNHGEQSTDSECNMLLSGNEERLKNFRPLPPPEKPPLFRLTPVHLELREESLKRLRRDGIVPTKDRLRILRIIK